MLTDEDEDSQCGYFFPFYHPERRGYFDA